MSTKYPGGLITKTPVTPAGPYQTGAAPGVWTVEQVLQYTKQGIWPIAGNAPSYIEDVFSTYVYAGNGSTQTITNGIDLSGQGGLVWGKSRTNAANHFWTDTARGYNKVLYSDLTNTQGTSTVTVTGFNSTGFGLGAGDIVGCNNSGQNYVSWTFRKQAKFFDVVTYSGTGSVQNIAHSLGSVPGCIIVKSTSVAGCDWIVYHKSLGNTKAIYLNLTSAAGTSSSYWNNTTPTSTQFTVATNGYVNQNGGSYVAYLFADNAGGFGPTGTDNAVSCGTFTLDGASFTSVTLGYEPQWIMFKKTDGIEDWWLFDNMRGFNYSQTSYLQPNTSNTESTFSNNPSPTATGFIINGAAIGAGTYVYVAIRRGPMKVPTTGTSVFSPVAITGTGTGGTVTSNFATDTVWEATRNTGRTQFRATKLTGTNFLTQSTAAEQTALSATYDLKAYINTGVTYGTPGNTYLGFSGDTDIFWNFVRAPGFHDVVCYTGTAANTALNHSLGVTPELVILKSRTITGGAYTPDWIVWKSTFAITDNLQLNTTAAKNSTYSSVFNAAPTSTVLNLGPEWTTNYSGDTYVAYLFASIAGVSKVGSYTGTGATQTISCGFTGGVRMVIIKRTDTTGIWYIWDTARGMVAGTDPKTNLSTATAETNANWVYTIADGFQIVTTDANVNASGGTYIYLAIA